MSAEHFRQIAERIATAENSLIATLTECGKISEGEATRVAAYYKKHRLVKLDLTNQRYNVVHGGLLERNIIRVAVEKSIVD